MSTLSEAFELTIDTEQLRRRRTDMALSLGCSRSIWSQILGIVDVVEEMTEFGPAALIVKPPEFKLSIPAGDCEYLITFQGNGGDEFPTGGPLADKFTLYRGSLDQPAGEAGQELMTGYFGSMVDLNRLTHWLIEGCEPPQTMYERLVRLHEEARRRGIC